MKTNRNKEFLSYVLPSVLAFALSGVYTIVDGFFVGRSLGDAGIAAITLGYPLSAFIQAVGTGIGLAGAIRFTIFKAQNKETESREYFSATTFLMLSVGVLLTLVLSLLAKPILTLFGATGETLRMSAEYVKIIALGAIFQLLATGFVPFIRNMNGSTFAMVAMILGFLTNVALDFTFVWVLSLGMEGAAWATIIGQAVTMLAAVVFFFRKRLGVQFQPPGKLFPAWGETLKVALSPFGLTFSPMITLLLMNRFLLLYGSEQAVAVYGCIGYVTSIIYLLLQGVGDGCQPLISHYYGQKDSDGVKQTVRAAYIIALAISLICMVDVFFVRGKVGVLFGASSEANTGVIRYLPYFLVPMLFLAFVRITTSYYYATEKNILSYTLVYAEPVLTFLLLLTLPTFLKLEGVWLAVPIAQGLTFLIALSERLILSRKNKDKTEQDK